MTNISKMSIKKYNKKAHIELKTIVRLNQI